MASFVGAPGRTPISGEGPLAPTCKARENGGVRPLRGRNDEVEAQSRSERDRWTFYNASKTEDSPKDTRRWLRKKPQMQGTQKLRSEAHISVRRNDEVEAQRSRWTFYEVI